VGECASNGTSVTSHSSSPACRRIWRVRRIPAYTRANGMYVQVFPLHFQKHLKRHIHVHACMHACMHVCMYACMYVHIYIYACTSRYFRYISLTSHSSSPAWADGRVGE
jgi:hypothetical protein